MSIGDIYEDENLPDYWDGQAAEHNLWVNIIKDRMKKLEDENNNFRDMVFNVPKKVERDFIAYMTLKDLLGDDDVYV